MQGNKELKRCSRCGSTMLLEYFERKRKGELLKTWNSCKEKKTPPIDILIGGVSTATNGTNDETISTTTPESSDNLTDNISTNTRNE